MSQDPLASAVQSTHLVPPHNDLEHVSQYNDHAIALVVLLRSRNIPNRHHPLILGLFSVYSLLVALGYITSANVSWPPHSDFRRQDWLDIGFSAEVVDILELLPFLQDDINYSYPVDIGHDAPTLSYLGKGIAEYRGTAEIPLFLDPADFFIRGNGRNLFGPGNLYYVYRGEDAAISLVKGWSDDWISYKRLPSHPAQLIMDNWVRNIYDLTYLPVRTKLEAQPVPEFEIDSGSRLEPTQAELIAYANPPDWRPRIIPLEELQRNELNRFRAIRNLYRQFGWPNQFNREGFRAALDEFLRKVDALDRNLRRFNPRAFWPVPDITFTPEEMAIRREKDEFLQETAGPSAIGGRIRQI